MINVVMSKIINICNYLIKNSKITISSTFLPLGLGHAALPPIKTTTF
jgi:hypothetical protein